MPNMIRSFVVIGLLMQAAQVGLAVEIGDTVRVVRKTSLRVETEAVATVPSGTELKVENINGEWLWVTYAGKQGWVAGKDVAGDTPLLDEMIKLEPQNAGLYQARGLLLMTQGKLDKAMQDFQDGVRLAPNEPQSYNCRGVGFYRLGKYDEAIADFDRVLRLDPKHVDAVRNRGSCWRAKKDYDRAITDYDEALRRSPQNADVYFDRGLAWYGKRDLEKAEADLGEALKFDARHEQALYNHGLVRQERKNYDGAIDDFTALLKANPKKYEVYVDRGNCREFKGEHEAAVADYDLALGFDPNYADALYDRGNSFRALGRYARAVQDYRAAIASDPRLHGAHNNLAWTLATCPDPSVRDGKDAVAHALQACELSGWKSPGSIAVLAAAYAEAGQFDSAVKYQQQALAEGGPASQAAYQERLKLFQDRKAYHEAPHPK